jgi:hypothetical protein
MKKKGIKQDHDEEDEEYSSYDSDGGDIDYGGDNRKNNDDGALSYDVVLADDVSPNNRGTRATAKIKAEKDYEDWVVDIKPLDSSSQYKFSETRYFSKSFSGLIITQDGWL